MSSEDNTSTLQSLVDGAKGAVQSGIAAVTGNSADQSKADQYKDKAQFENDASHTAAKLGPFTATPSGAVAQDNPNRTQGSWDQTIGSGKEMIGNALGFEGLKQEGIKQNQDGKAAEAKGQLSDLGSGIGDRITGAAGAAYAGLTGDTQAQQKYQDKHDVGKTLQRGVEHDVQKQADAQQ